MLEPYRNTMTHCCARGVVFRGERQMEGVTQLHHSTKVRTRRALLLFTDRRNLVSAHVPWYSDLAIHPLIYGSLSLLSLDIYSDILKYVAHCPIFSVGRVIVHDCTIISAIWNMWQSCAKWKHIRRIELRLFLQLGNIRARSYQRVNFRNLYFRTVRTLPCRKIKFLIRTVNICCCR
jgi:hypothetical protein